MFTTDLALKFDPTYREISKRFLDNADGFELAFAKAWFKLTHHDIAPRALYLGDEVPEAVLLWQDPGPTVDHALIDDRDISELKQRILAFGRTTGVLARIARVSASSFRASDRHARRRQSRAHTARAAERLAGK